MAITWGAWTNLTASNQQFRVGYETTLSNANVTVTAPSADASPTGTTNIAATRVLIDMVSPLFLAGAWATERHQTVRASPFAGPWVSTRSLHGTPVSGT